MASLPKCLPAGELLKQMQKSSVTDGWDLVVSYSLERLNLLVADDWKTRTGPSIGMIIDDAALGSKYKIDLQLGFMKPELRIQDGILVAFIDIPIVACNYWIAAGVTEDEIEDDLEAEWREVSPNAYFMRCQVPQEHIVGHYSHGKEAIAEQPKADAKEFITFGSEALTGGASDLVIFEFLRGPGTFWTIQQAPDFKSTKITIDEHFFDIASKKILFWMEANVTRGLRVLWEDKGNLVLPGIEASFRPDHFLITATGADKGGVISIWIKVDGSENGAGNQHPKTSGVRAPAMDPICLLPDDKSTSIVIGRQFFLRKFLYDTINSEIIKVNKNVPMSIMSSDSGFRFDFVYAEDKMILGMWFLGKPRDNIYTETRTYDNNNYYVDLSAENTLSISRTAESFKNNAVTFVMTCKKTWPAFFIIGDGHVLKMNNPASITGDDILIQKKDVGWFGEHYSPEGKGVWRFQMHEYPTLTINCPQISFKPFCNLIVAALSEKTTWDNTINLPHDLIVWGNISESSSAPPVVSGAPVVPAPLEALKGTPKKLYPSEPPRKTFFDPFFDSEDLLLLFLLGAATRSPTGLLAIGEKFGVKLPATDIKQILNSFQVGPDFDPRLAAGVYQLETPDWFDDSVWFIDTLSQPPRVFMNNVLATTVSLMDSACHLEFTFTITAEQIAKLEALEKEDKALPEDPEMSQDPLEPAQPAQPLVPSTMSFSLIFSFPLDTPNRPVSFSGTVSATAEGSGITTTHLLRGYQVHSDLYPEFVEDQAGWGAVRYLTSMYGLWGVIGWLCVNSFRMVDDEKLPSFQIDQSSDAWNRLQRFSEFWTEPEAATSKPEQ